MNLTKAQVYLSTALDNYYDDNIYNNYTNVSDFVNIFSGELGYDFETERNLFEIYYLGSYNNFNSNPSKSSIYHKFGFVETYLLAEDDNPLNIGLYYDLRNNRDEFEIYDYTQLTGYANYMHSITDVDKIQFGGILNKIDYKNYSMFSYYESKGFLRTIFNFQTKTSLTLAAELDYKQYIEKSSSPELANETLQSKYFIQLGQSITETLGFGSYFLLRKNLEGGNRYFTQNDFIYYEEELFNNIYSNDGYEIGLNLSYLFSPEVLGKIEGRYTLRNFTDLPAASIDDVDLDVNREDKQFMFGALLNFNLDNILDGLGLFINYNFIKNQSNDYYYDYNNQVFAVSLGLDF